VPLGLVVVPATSISAVVSVETAFRVVLLPPVGAGMVCPPPRSASWSPRCLPSSWCSSTWR